ncbi:hypothetical protein C6P41_001546 [Kluyveromyces marxianus]|nr:hypothetical protein C6P43_000544 [Kluyveromyces marxianus]KAG0677053.1 hypothetical protein C6P41_001546 [Kluyveromyces marxianus]
MDSDQVKKRMSQIELEISEMNEMIEKNLRMQEGSSDVQDGETDHTTGATKGASEKEFEDDNDDDDYAELRKLTAEQVDEFVQNAITSEGEETDHREEKTEEPVQYQVKPETEIPITATTTVTAAAVTTDTTTSTTTTGTTTTDTITATTTATKEDESGEVPPETTSKKPNPVAESVSVPEPTLAFKSEPVRRTSQKIDASTSTDEFEQETKADIITKDNDKSKTYPEPASSPASASSTTNTKTCSVVSPTNRSLSNPFRVVHVGSQPSSRNGSRVSSAASNSSTASGSDVNIEQLQKNYNVLSMKCTKLKKEIEYLNKFQQESTLTLEDRCKLIAAIEKLQEYLDKKNRQRYDTGVILSRQIRKTVDMGTNGQFWVGRT